MRRMLLLLSLGGLLACGYHSGQIVPGDGRSVCVPVFGNTTWRRDLERDLTRQVTEEIRSGSGFVLSDDETTADIVIRGDLTRVSEEVLSEREGGEIRESSVTMTATVRIVERGGTGKPPPPFEVSSRKSFAPGKGESIRTAESAAMREIARRIVYSLAREW